MVKYYEFRTEEAAKERHQALTRLGWHPHSIFRIANGGWAFWTA